ncbi:MAG: CRISPR-associated helicase Cas3' [Hyphomicrobiales bacterium]|nr:CRISPR-associated helicase Cas3' [Hyphomicrobiales bacterium]
MLFADFFERVTGRQPYGYQCQLAANGWPDALIVPTGLGKTAGVALAWLHKRVGSDHETPRRLVWCLPMRTLVEQTAKNVGAWLSKIKSAGLDPKGHLPNAPSVLMGGEVDDKWIRCPEAPAILIGTQDILLSRALMRGYGVGRARWPVDFALLHNDAMWVFDEVQLMAAGAPTSAQLEAFRREIGCRVGCRSLWMSATLERDWLKTVDFEKHAAKLVVQELTDADRAHPAVQQRFAAPKSLARAETIADSAATSGRGTTQYVARLADEVMEKHRCGKTTLVILNRVGRAQALYDSLKEKKAPGLLLVHSRFRPAERETINKQLAEQPDARGRIIVATQAVEAGVDITSAVMFTELAPWASLVQRFGRLNRGGEEKKIEGSETELGAQALWIDIAAGNGKTDNLALPYTSEELAAARERLEKLADVSPKSLEGLAHGSQGAWQVLRRKDLCQLFDTDPDLTGFDVDVSPYVRGADDTDVRVFWRNIANCKAGPQGEEAGRPHRDEMCAVPIGQARSWLGKHKSRAFVWDWVEKGWTKFEQLWPGAVVLVDAKVGGYDPMRGFDMESTYPVSPVEVDGAVEAEPDRFGDDPDTRKDPKVELRDHLRHVHEKARRLCKALEVQGVEAEAVVTAALWHDLGKAHEVFMARCGLAPNAAPLAKTLDYNWRMKCPPNRRYFRHELASALAWLQNGPQSETHDLVAYLIAAHHGKVRMGLRALPDERGPDDADKRFARGVWDGDRLPAFSVDALSIPDTTLALDVMELGGGATGRSWATRTLELLERYGPFRLAFLEALVRIADWRASEAEQKTGDLDA